MIFQYEFTNVETHQESDKKKANIGSFSMRPDKEIKTKAKILNKDEDEIYKDFDIKERSYTIYNVVLPKNVKKLKDLDPDNKDVLTTKYGDNMTPGCLLTYEIVPHILPIWSVVRFHVRIGK